MNLKMIFMLKEQDNTLTRTALFFFSLFYFASPSGKIILFTKKNTTIDTPPLSTVVHPGTNIPATATQIQLIEFTIHVTIQNAIRYQNA
mgnify:CR=1 FL=1